MDLQVFQMSLKEEIEKTFNLFNLYRKKYSDKDVRAAFFELSHTSLYCHYRNFYTTIDSAAFHSSFKEIAIIHNENTLFGNYWNQSNFAVFIRVFSTFELTLNMLCQSILDEKTKLDLLKYKAEELKKDLKKEGINLSNKLYNEFVINTYSKVPFPRKLNAILKYNESALKIKRKEIYDFFECLMHYRNSMHNNFMYQGENKNYEFESKSEKMLFAFENNRVVNVKPNNPFDVTIMVFQIIEYVEIIFSSINYESEIIDPTFETWY